MAPRMPGKEELEKVKAAVSTASSKIVTGLYGLFDNLKSGKNELKSKVSDGMATLKENLEKYKSSEDKELSEFHKHARGLHTAQTAATQKTEATQKAEATQTDTGPSNTKRPG